MSPAILSLLLGIILAAVARAALAGGGARAQRVIGAGALAAALLLLLARQFGLAAALAMAGAALLARERAQQPSGGDGWTRSGGASQVRSAVLAMRLDHDTGEMDGEVLAGPFAGRALSSLTLEEALTLAASIDPADAQSLSLLRAWLGRAHPGWRDEAEPERDAPPASPDAPMTRARAYEILGLDPGADAEAIRAAHRRLMKRVHPDQGGSAALAAEINAAKAALLG